MAKAQYLQVFVFNWSTTGRRHLNVMTEVVKVSKANRDGWPLSSKTLTNFRREVPGCKACDVVHSLKWTLLAAATVKSLKSSVLTSVKEIVCVLVHSPWESKEDERKISAVFGASETIALWGYCMWSVRVLSITTGLPLLLGQCVYHVVYQAPKFQLWRTMQSNPLITIPVVAKGWIPTPANDFTL